MYLTPNAPFDSGTRFYRNAAYRCQLKTMQMGNANELKALSDDNKRNDSAWKIVDTSGSRFTRLLFLGVQYRQSAEFERL